MITAHCDVCAEEIDAETPAGCRVVLGKHEWSFHLCPAHMEALRGKIETFLAAHPWRVVK